MNEAEPFDFDDFDPDFIVLADDAADLEDPSQKMITDAECVPVCIVDADKVDAVLAMLRAGHEALTTARDLNA